MTTNDYRIRSKATPQVEDGAQRRPVTAFGKTP